MSGKLSNFHALDGSNPTTVNWSAWNLAQRSSGLLPAKTHVNQSKELHLWCEKPRKP